MIESELGLIPDGWASESISDAATVTYGYPFKSKLFTTGGDGTGVVRIRDVRKDFPSVRTSEVADEKYLLRNGDLIVGMDGQFHMGRWAGGSAYLNQRVARFRPIRGLPPYYLFLALEPSVKALEASVTGTTVAHLLDRDIRRIQIVRPDPETVRWSASFLDPLFELELNLRRKNAMLRTTRDFLLPKLISGEIDPPESKVGVAA
jgi:type I restriction enzyme S subunit